MENNAWTKLYEEKLGIKVKYDWLVPDQETYDQKMNVTIASNSLPDIMTVNAVQFKDLAEAGLLADLTESLDKYGSPLIKQELNKDGGESLKAATVKGKLMGIPVVSNPADLAHVLWVRTDWLKKLNLPEPKTMQDVFAISEAFTNKDPDGNGKNDTFGLGLDKTLFGTPGALGFFNGYHAYPQIWVKDSSGQVVYGSIQPEMKSALAKLAEMYKSGQIDREFGVKDSAKVDETLSSGKLGMAFGAMWFPGAAGLANGKKLNPEVEWQGYKIPSIDGNPAMASIGFGVSTFYVVNKKAKNPEALIKIINMSQQLGLEKDKETLETYGDKDGIPKWMYQLAMGVGEFNSEKYQLVTKALNESNPDITKFSGADNFIYEEIMKFRDDSKYVSGWTFDRIFGPKSSQEILFNYTQNKELAITQYYGAPTPAMVSQKPALDKLELEEFTKIIMGASSPDAFDAFVANWKKLGGDQIMKEINDELKKNQ